MKRALCAPLFVALLMVAASQQANAGHSGAVSYSGCDPCCQPHYHTVYRTVRCTVYDRVPEPRYRTVCEKVPFEKVVNYTKYVSEKRTKEVKYTVMVPTYETNTRCYTV